MNVSPVAWGITIAVLAAFLIFDIVIVGRRPHVPSTREALLTVVFYVVAALAFGAGVWFFAGGQHAGEFYAGWLTEYSLSVDNLFIFLLIMSKMAVPEKLQQYALLVGIVLALIFRGAFIAMGAMLISAFAWVFVIFGLFLLYTAYKLIRDWMRPGDDDTEGGDNWLVRRIRATVPSTTEFHGTRWFTRVEGQRLMTPMALVIVALGSTDLMFALDSIPAVFGQTKEPYLVFAATVFALMGLRQLYFLLGTALQKLVYLSVGLAVILAFIGVKLLLEAAHHYALIGFEIPTPLSLLFIVLALVVTAVASLWKTRRDERQPETHGPSATHHSPLASDETASETGALE